MTGTKISDMPAAASLDGTEIVPLLQSGANKRTTTQAIADLGGGGGGGPQLATVAVSQADLLALHSSPKILVAAPGANKIIVPMALALHYNFGTTGYTDSNGAFIAFGGETNTNFNVFSIAGDEFTKDHSVSTLLPPEPASFPIKNIANANLVNLPLVLGTYTADMTDGDGTGVVMVYYFVMSI